MRTKAFDRYAGATVARRCTSRLASSPSGISISGRDGATRVANRMAAAVANMGAATGTAAATVTASRASARDARGRRPRRRASNASAVLPTRLATSICATVARTARSAAGGSRADKSSVGNGCPASAQPRAYVSNACSASSWAPSPRKSRHDPWIHAV